MAQWRVDGLDRIQASLYELGQLSDDQIWGIIEPGAELLKTKMQEVISRMFRQISGSLQESIEIKQKIDKAGVISALVGPNQKKHPKATAGKRKSRSSKKGGGGGSYAGTNAEVGWILEYGSARITGRHWMETAVDEVEEELYQTLEQGFNDAIEAAGL